MVPHSSHLRESVSWAASDMVLECRFDVLLSDTARMGYGAPWTYPLVHGDQDQRDYVNWVFMFISGQVQGGLFGDEGNAEDSGWCDAISHLLE